MSTASPVNGHVLGGWYGAELAKDPASWRVSIPGDVRDDLLRAARDLGPGGISPDPIHPRPKVGEGTRSLVADLYRRLSAEPGM
ncbi:MAG: hypothetical protein ACRDOO_25595, partial [Actinomadura sp.]